MTDLVGGTFSRRELLDAGRLAIQSAIAAAAMFVAMQSLGMPEKFVGVLSAVLVVRPSVGSTLGEAWNRFVATLVGSVIGVCCLVALPGGYGTAAALGVSMFVMNGAAGLWPEWRYGVVAAVALSLGAESDVLETARDRALAIGMGALLGAVVSLVVWPDTARSRAKRHVRGALLAAAERLEATVERARGERSEAAEEARESYHAHIDAARKAAEGVRFGGGDALEEQIDRTSRLYNSILILHRVGEETDRAVEGDDELREVVETMRDRASELTRALADGEKNEDQFERLDETLDRARRLVSEFSGDPLDQIVRSTLVFGLGEVRDSLEGLSDAIPD